MLSKWKTALYFGENTAWRNFKFAAWHACSSCYDVSFLVRSRIKYQHAGDIFTLCHFVPFFLFFSPLLVETRRQQVIDKKTIWNSFIFFFEIHHDLCGWRVRASLFEHGAICSFVDIWQRCKIKKTKQNKCRNLLCCIALHQVICFKSQ